MRNLMLCILLLSTYASAEVRFYGSLGSGIESGRFRWNGQSTTQTAVRDLGSYVGIQGRHPIGGQNAPGWQWTQPPLPANNPTDKQQSWPPRQPADFADPPNKPILPPVSP